MTGVRHGQFVALIAPLLALTATRRNKSEAVLPTPHIARVLAHTQQGATTSQQDRNKAYSSDARGARKGAAIGATKPYRVVALVAPSTPVDCWAAQVRRGLDVFGSFPWGCGPRVTRDRGVSPGTTQP